MSDSAMAVIAIFLAAILMFVVPLMAMADKKDDVSTLTVQSAVDDLTISISNTGKLTKDQYDNFVQQLAATTNSYDVEITVQILDENPAKKETSIKQTIGDNVYYTLNTTQVLERLNSGTLVLKEGDIVTINAKNTNVTIGMQLRNFMYKVTGNNSSTITATATRMVTTNGN